MPDSLTDLPSPACVPSRADTLRVLRLMGEGRPLYQITGSEDGYGTRWLLDGQSVAGGIVRYLSESGFIAPIGSTEVGTIRLMLTASGHRLREAGQRWWQSLSLPHRLWIQVFG